MSESKGIQIGDIAALIKATEDSLAAQNKEQNEVLTVELATMKQQLQSAAMKKDISGLNELMVKVTSLSEKMELNQTALDGLLVKASQPKGKNTTSFSEAYENTVAEKFDDIKHLEKNKGKVTLEIKNFDVKTVGNMLLSSNLTGDQMATYVGQGILPADLINLRDLIPTRTTTTGLAVSYREGVGEGAVARQTEGSAKAQVDSDFTEVKIVQRYIAAFQRASKQMLQDFSFLSTTMPRILMRKYMSKENLLLYADLSSSTYSTANSPSGGNTVEKILNMIKTQRNNNYSASFVLVTWDDWYNILVSARPSTGVDYSIPFGAFVSQNGDILVGGVKVIPASWVTASDIQVIDTAYIERLEVDSLKIEISTEDADNFTKNLVTMKVECRTDLNSLLTTAHLNYGTAS